MKKKEVGEISSFISIGRIKLIFNFHLSLWFYWLQWKMLAGTSHGRGNDANQRRASKRTGCVFQALACVAGGHQRTWPLVDLWPRPGQRLLTPSPVLGLFVLPTMLTAEVISRIQLWEHKMLLRGQRGCPQHRFSASQISKSPKYSATKLLATHSWQQPVSRNKCVSFSSVLFILAQAHFYYLQN